VMRASLAMAAAVAAPLLMAGCGRSPPTTFLALEPAPPAAAAAASSYRGPPVRVPFLRVPVTLDRPEFVRQVAGTVVVSDFDRWAAPLARLARDTLIQNLQARLAAGAVLPPDAGPAVPEVRIEATVLSFRVVGAEAVMDVSYRLVRPSSPRAPALAAPPRPVTLRTPLGGDSPAAQAAAWSVLLGLLADRIAAELT